jgi:hypothetical protein
MTTKREQILSAITTALASTSGVSGRVYRSRVEPLARGESPAVVIEPIIDQADNSVLPKLDWSLTVRIAVIVRGNIPDQVADPIIESIHSKLLSDASLLALITSIIPTNVTFDSMEADQPAGVVGMDYQIRYRTSVTNLSAT